MNVRRFSPTMGPRLVASFVIALLVGPGPAHGQNGAVGIAYPAKGIVVDGDLGDWPEGLPVYPVERIESGDKPGGRDDLEARFRIAHDAGEHALYVAVEVRDESLVLDGPGEAVWNAQDGCEVFLDAAHAVGGSPFVQYARYGEQDRFVGPEEVPEARRKVAVARAAGRIVYEWRIVIDGDLDPDRVIGFDLSVADKDQDGSFSWDAWGPGTQKVDTPNRCGEILIVGPGTRFGEVSGVVAWKEDSTPSALPARVRVQSTRFPAFWLGAIVDPAGSYKVATLPAGSYSIRPVDSAFVRVEETASVEVRVEADQLAKADTLRITPVPWPGLIGEEGVLRGAGPFDAAGFDRFVQAYLDYFKTPGISVAVIKDSQVIHHRGFGVRNAATGEPVSEDTVFEAASMTKPVFAYVVLRLVDRGVLDLDTPLYTYLPYEDAAHDDRYKLITARMVLTHRTGFPNWRTGKLEIKFAPGAEFGYSGEGFVYLGKVVEKLTGKKLVDLCREEVFAPLGIKNASLIYDDDVARLTATGHAGRSPLPKWKVKEPNTAASLHVDAGQYSRFLIAVLQGRGLAESTASEMLRPQTKVPDQPGSSFGLGIAIDETPQGTHYGHGGRNTGFTSRSVMDRDRGFGYVFIVNNDDASKFDDVLNAYLIAGKSSVKGNRRISHKLAKVEPKVFDDYVGRYEVGKETIVTITREGDRLMAQTTGEGKVELFPESETVFFFNPATDVTLTFARDDEGKVTHLVAHEDGHDTRARRLDEPEAKPNP